MAFKRPTPRSCAHRSGKIVNDARRRPWACPEPALRPPSYGPPGKPSNALDEAKLTCVAPLRLGEEIPVVAGAIRRVPADYGAVSHQPRGQNKASAVGPVLETLPGAAGGRPLASGASTSYGQTIRLLKRGQWHGLTRRAGGRRKCAFVCASDSDRPHTRGTMPLPPTFGVSGCPYGLVSRMRRLAPTGITYIASGGSRAGRVGSAGSRASPSAAGERRRVMGSGES